MAAQGIDALLIQIAAAIQDNANNDIEGDILQLQLTDMVESLNQELYDNTIPYNIGQGVIFDDGGTLKFYQCVVDTTAGQSPTGTPGSWTIVGAAGAALDEIVGTIQNLRDVVGPTDEDQALVNANNGLYEYDDTDDQADDGDLVVVPTGLRPADGSWLKQKVFVDTTTTGALGDLITTTQANLVAAINERALWGVELVTNITGLKNILAERREVKLVTVEFYDEASEGAVAGGVRRVLFYKGTDLTDPEWQDLANWQQLEPIVTTGFTTTTTVGGVAAATAYTVGTTLESIVKEILAPYVASSISTFTLNTTPGDTILEVGATTVINDVTLAVSNDSEGDPPTVLSISGLGFTPPGNGSVGANDPTPDDLDVTKTTDTSETWQGSGEDANSDPINTLSATRTWYFLHSVGGSSTSITAGSTDGEVTTLIDSLDFKVLRSGKSASITCNANNANAANYTYIVYAAKYGDLSNVILNGSSSVLGSFTEIADFDYTNSETHVESYRLYKSNATGAFANGDTLAIS